MADENKGLSLKGNCPTVKDVKFNDCKFPNITQKAHNKALKTDYESSKNCAQI